MRIGSFIAVIIFATITMRTGFSNAENICFETNDNLDQSCGVSCSAEVDGVCTHGSGATAPSCSCSGNFALKSGQPLRMLLKMQSPAKFSMNELAELAQSPAPATTTNIIQTINSKLATLRDYHLSDSCHEEHDQCYGPPICTGINRDHCTNPVISCNSRQVCQPVVGKLSVTGGLIASKGPVATLGKFDDNNIPTSVFTASAAYKNCSATSQSQTFTHTEQLQVGHTVTKTIALTTGSTMQVSLSGTLKLGKSLTIGGRADRSVRETATITTADAETSTVTQIETATLPQIVPAMDFLLLTSTFVQYNINVPFSGTVSVDGQIAANLEGIGTLSQVLPTEADRTFDFAGVVTDTTGVNFQTQMAEKKLMAADCASANKGLVTTTSGNATSQGK